MREKYERMIRAELQGIQESIRFASAGTRNKVGNRCRKVLLIIKKINKIMEAQERYIARRAIFEAMTNGRKLSQMDCREFEVEDMRTPMSHMREEFERAGFVLQSEWIRTPKGRRIKEYWLDRVNN
jgi:hypothetical protein